jgi:hypothetical protein
VNDSGGGSAIFPIPKGQTVPREGVVTPGGFLTVVPCDTCSVFYAGAGTRFRYALVTDPVTGRVSQLQVGLGQAGQRVQAGTEITYRFAMATLGGERLTPEEYVARLESIGNSFGIGGGERGVRTSFTAGTLVGREAVLTVQARDNEAAFTVAPCATIVDLPIRLQGIEDNGCVAVHSTTRPFFRFVGVAEGSAWFQENVDAGSTIWAGNVFVCDNKAIRLTLVSEGLAPGRQPFLEVHNPTDAPVQTAVSSPPHTPLYGGVRLTATVPAGASAILPLPPAKAENR